MGLKELAGKFGLSVFDRSKKVHDLVKRIKLEDQRSKKLKADYLDNRTFKGKRIIGNTQMRKLLDVTVYISKKQ